MRARAGCGRRGCFGGASDRSWSPRPSWVPSSGTGPWSLWAPKPSSAGSCIASRHWPCSRRWPRGKPADRQVRLLGARVGRYRRSSSGESMRTLIILAYFVIGGVVASSHHYFAHLGSVDAVISAILAVVLWPLVLLHVNLHIGGTKAGK